MTLKLDRTRTTGSHEAKKIETPKPTAETAPTTPPPAGEKKSGPANAFSTAAPRPDTTPVGIKDAAVIPTNISFETIPHDPNVDMGKWVDKHLDDAKAKAPAAGASSAKEAQKVGDAESVPKAKLLMCPVLGSLVKEGSLKVDDKGDISLKELNDAMVNRLGITRTRAAVTVSTGTIGNHLSDLGSVLSGKLNLDHLAGSFLDHRKRGDTGILEGGVFNEDKFKALCSHSTDGKTMTSEDFGRAIRAQLKRDQGVATQLKGRSEDLFEMAALINTFGYKDENGVRRISFETMRNLYEHQQLPSKDELMARKPTGVAEHLATMAKMATKD